nr:hypothetical protein [Tanacetum cinerariifolium]
MMSWNTSADCCNWHGVTLSNSVSIAEGCKLAGQIDVGQLTNLTHLDLSSNNFSGELELDTLLSTLTNLERLDLSYSGFSVTTKNVNHYVNPGLIYLELASCKLKVFPNSLRPMKQLAVLDLSSNKIHGQIPHWAWEIGVLWKYHLISYTGKYGDNSFQGTIPTLYDCENLEGLILKGNQLEGEVPISLSKCQSLKVVDFGNNHLNGTFPGWATPSKIFSKFQFHEEHGEEYYSFVVALKGVNQDFPQISLDYTIIDLSNNTFEGQIPKFIGGLNSLIVLNLSHNSLIGPIPHALGNLIEIESLDLSWNQLSGEIPQSLARITTLEVLNLSQNHLVGRIPGGPQFSTFSTSFGGNSGLYGFPLAKREHQSSPQVEDNDKEEEESGFTWKMVMLGYGCGTIIGLVMGYLMLSSTRPNWLSAIADAGEQMILKRRDKRRRVYMRK